MCTQTWPKAWLWSPFLPRGLGGWPGSRQGLGHLLVPEMESLISQSDGGKSDPVVAVGLPKGSRAQLHLPGLLSGAVGVRLLSGRHRQVALFPCAWGAPEAGEEFWAQRPAGGDDPLSLSPLAQRAIRVRSHSMETMVGSQKKHHGSGIPGSLSGGIAHNSGEVTKTTFSVSMSTCPCVPVSLPFATPPQPQGLSDPDCSLLPAPCPSRGCQEPVQEPHQAPLRAVPSPAHDIGEPGGEQDEVVSL